MSAEPLPTRLPDPGECPDCAEARRALMEERIRRQDVEKDLAGKRAQITKLKDELAGKRRTDPLYDTAEELWRYWRKTCKPKARTFSADQQKAVLARLNDRMADDPEQPAYPPRYIAEAIAGAAAEHFVDARGRHFCDLELICRNGAKLEGFHAVYERRKGADG